jgi:signal transduction histidine kinase
VAASEAYCGHPTPAMYGFQSYISIPIFLKDGSFFGTLCAIDPRPARLSGENVEIFEVFARLIAFHIDAVARLASSEANLLDERATSELREQFIAILGHDLRNPLASIAAGATLLKRASLTDKAAGIVGMMQASVARMSALIDNVLDFARGRLGGGLTLNRVSGAPLEPVLQQVIAELRSSNPGRAIEVDLDLRAPIACDHGRIGQLLSNLLGNALTYGAADKPIRVGAATDGRSFALSVSNAGDPIPASAVNRLFLPFSRGAGGADPQGLGLGLYIASEIARAHGGSIDVTSTPAETRFTFRMPLA